MQLLDGRALAEKIHNEIREEIIRLNLTPGLGVILVGDNPASEQYVEIKKQKAQELGFYVDIRHLPRHTTKQELGSEILQFNSRPDIHGFIVQLPLPPPLQALSALRLIDPEKDADGLHPLNIGNLACGAPTITPATPAGVLRLLEQSGIPIAGAHAVVVGRSNIVGKPIALMLLARNATVTVCHSHTKDLAFYTKNADILVVAAGQPRLITGSMIKSGACVIDVGSTKVKGKWVGDVDFSAEGGSPPKADAPREHASGGDSFRDKAGFITPVPGGVGPMTVAMLLKNTLELAKQHL